MRRRPHPQEPGTNTRKTYLFDNNKLATFLDRHKGEAVAQRDKLAVFIIIMKCFPWAYIVSIKQNADMIWLRTAKKISLA